MNYIRNDMFTYIIYITLHIKIWESVRFFKEEMKTFFLFFWASSKNPEICIS